MSDCDWARRHLGLVWVPSAATSLLELYCQVCHRYPKGEQL